MPGSRPVTLVLSGRIGAADVAPLCDKVAELLAGRQAVLIVCDVGGVADPGLATVDVLARLGLAAGRRGRRIRFWRVQPQLLELLALAGLDQVLPVSGGFPGACGPEVIRGCPNRPADRLPG
jgi:anti-anti-sigma regulatory factor